MAANWSNTQVINQLNSGYRWTGSTITYAFPLLASGMYSEGEGATFRPVSTAQQGLFTQAIQAWDDLIQQSFVLTTDTSSNIEFGYTTSNIDYAQAYFPSLGSAWFRTGSDVATASVGSYGYTTIMHELGHAIGLDHMGDYNGQGNWTPSSFQDSVVLSIMSYFGPNGPLRSSEVMGADWVSASGQACYAQTPMLNDVMAIQAIYGASTTTRSGDTVYGFSCNISGSAANTYDFSINRNPILTIFESGGNDTLNLSGWTSPSIINLEPGVYSSCNDMTNNIVIAYNTIIENAVGGGGPDVLTGNSVANRLEGGAGNDRLSGGAGNDVLIGGPGNDTIEGGAGDDTAAFADVLASYSIAYNSSSGVLTLSGGSTGSDSVTGVEYFQFGDTTRTLSQLLSVVTTPPTTDTLAPTLTSLSPADNATGVAVSANLVLSFSEAVKAGVGDIAIYNANGSIARTISITDTSQVSILGNTVTLNPSSDLAAGSSYYVNIAAGVIKDLSGNNFAGVAGSTAYNFSTAGVSTVDDFPWDTSTTGVVTVNGAGTLGVINTSDDMDLFKVNLVSGQKYVFKMTSTGTVGGVYDPYLVLYSPDLTAVAADDDSGGGYNAQIAYTATRSGTFYLGAMDFGLSTGSYTLSAATVAAPDDYASNTTTTGLLTAGGQVTGTLEVAGDDDWFKITLAAGKVYIFELKGADAGGGTLGSVASTQPYLSLYDASGRFLDYAYNGGNGGDPILGLRASTSGTYYVSASELYDQGMGTYTLKSSVGGLRTTGTSASETLGSSIGDDTIDGGAGTDTVTYAGVRTSYTVVKSGAGWTVGSAAGGVDTLANVERLGFADKILALDIEGTAGQAYRLYQAAFNRTPDSAGLKYWIDAMDKGASLTTVATGFIASQEFKTLYGSNPSNAQFVNNLYLNILHRTPDPGGYSFYVGQLDRGALNRTDALMQLSESPENKAGVIGSIQNGIDLFYY